MAAAAAVTYNAERTSDMVSIGLRRDRHRVACTPPRKYRCLDSRGPTPATKRSLTVGRVPPRPNRPVPACRHSAPPTATAPPEVNRRDGDATAPTLRTATQGKQTIRQMYCGPRPDPRIARNRKNPCEQDHVGFLFVLFFLRRPAGSATSDGRRCSSFDSNQRRRPVPGGPGW